MRGMVRMRVVPFALLAVMALALVGPALAAPVPSQTVSATAGEADAQAVAAERGMVQGKLMDFGLSEKQAADRVTLLTDQEVHAIAADLESVKAAGALGDREWDTVTVLLLLILVAILAD